MWPLAAARPSRGEGGAASLDPLSEAQCARRASLSSAALGGSRRLSATLGEISGRYQGDLGEISRLARLAVEVGELRVLRLHLLARGGRFRTSAKLEGRGLAELKREGRGEKGEREETDRRRAPRSFKSDLG